MNLALHRISLPARRSAGVLAAFSVLVLALAPAFGAALDKARIHADYQGGDFDKVIRDLERFRESGRPCRKDDSVFMEKHLAVVYAADPRTRERGRYHMLRMLVLDPKADILDMFVGEEVDGIFEKVRKEFALAPAAARPPAASPAPAPRPEVQGKARPRRSAQAAAPARPIPARAPAPKLKSWNLDKAGPPVRAARPAQPAPATAKTAPGVSSPAAMPNPPAPGQIPAPALRLTGRITPLDPPPASGHPASAAAAGTALGSRLKEPGFWVGSGAAVALVGLTLYFAGSREWDEPASRSRTFAVPSKTEP